VTGARRVLAFDQDEEFLGAASRLLAGAGFQFKAVRDPAQVSGQVADFKPDLILLDRAAPGTAFAHVVEALRDSPIPKVFVLADHGERELIRAVQAGAVEVMLRPFSEQHAARLGPLLDELARRPKDEKLSREEQIARNFMDVARRNQLRGSLVVNRTTPFEGRVVLKDGALVRASYGPLTGMDAVREILQLEDGNYELDSSLNLPTPKVAQNATTLDGQTLSLGVGDTADIRPRLLAVDDEPHLLALVSRVLVAAGFSVDTAVDGADAVEKARKMPFDLIVADLSMPRMDGWEMLKTLKADTRTAEVPVIFLSAHDDYREALRAARSGAHDYLAKTGRSDQVVGAALRTITPRLEIIFHLLVKEPVEVRTAAVGLQWFLRAAQRLACSGVLSLEDDWGHYQLAVRDGQPVGSQAVVQGRRVTGIPAFMRLMVAKGAQGAFTFGPLPDGTGDLSHTMEDLIAKACEILNANEAKAAEKKLASAIELDLDPELFDLFCRIAPARKVAFAQAICEKRMPLADVAGSLMISQEQAADWFRELLRREVLVPPAALRGRPDPSRPWTPNELHPQIVKRRERKRTIVEKVRAQLGEDPWVPIASEIATVLGLAPGRELTFPELVKFAAAHGFQWPDVHVVVELLTAFGVLQRRFVMAGSDLAATVPATEVSQRLGAAMADDAARDAWGHWAGGIRVVWRSTPGSLETYPT